MAFIDENNDVLAGKGKDPIKELDDELEALMAQLGELEKSDDLSQEEKTDKLSAKAPVPPAEDHPDTEEAQPMAQSKPKNKKKSPKKRSKAPIVIIVIVLVAGLIAGGVYAALKIWNSNPIETLFSNKDKPPAASETEQYYDPELGTVTVKKVDEEARNTYNIDNLVKNDNGYYEYYVDGNKTSAVGVDLSAHQGTVNFNAVKNSGVDFVILRVGGRYYSDDGGIYEDENFDTYYQQAKSAGLKVGAYFFSQAASTDDAVEEAEYVIKKLDGKPLDYPIAFDWETIEDDNARTDNIDGETITAMAEAFCDTIEKSGYDSMVYASTSLMLQSYDFDVMQDYKFWLADYREFPNMYYGFIMWQYATDGTVSGIEGSADLNICFEAY